AAPGHRRPSRRRATLRSVSRDGSMERADQRAAVLDPAFVADGVRLSRHDLRRHAPGRDRRGRLELTHARGETDDHTWLWWAARRILFTGDLFFWVAPNAGNPQKVQRYAAEWAVALRAMAARGAEVLVPGHGVPVVGAGRVRQALED